MFTPPTLALAHYAAVGMLRGAMGEVRAPPIPRTLAAHPFPSFNTLFLSPSLSPPRGKRIKRDHRPSSRENHDADDEIRNPKTARGERRWSDLEIPPLTDSLTISLTHASGSARRRTRYAGGTPGW